MMKAALLTAILVGCASPAVAQSRWAPVNLPPEPVLPRRGDQACSRLMAELRALREEALVLRERDGGTLTAEHNAMIQARLDAAWQRYRETPRRRRSACMGMD